MTIEELEKVRDHGYCAGVSIVPNDILDAGIHLKNFIALINQGWGNYEETETRTLLNTLDVIEGYFELVEKVRDKLE